LIGQVTSVNEESAYKSVNVHPIANLHNLDVVQVLTAASGSLPANLSRIAASLPAGQNQSGGATGEALASTGAAP
jgi:cell shape-determining protein MreC